MIKSKQKFNNKHYENKYKQNTQATIMKVNNDVYIRESKLTSFSLQYTFVRLCSLPYKKQVKAADWVSEVQAVLCEDSESLNIVIMIWRCPLQRSLQ